jgi:Leucine-rich repeat (LRR) protein
MNHHNNHPRTLRHGFASQGKFMTTNLWRMRLPSFHPYIESNHTQPAVLDSTTPSPMARDQAYYEAEKKIEEALKSGATELNLRDMRLTELPESIGNLIQLQKLDLGGDWVKRGDENNKLTTLPNSLKQLAQLQLLNLSSNQLTPPPEWLGQLTQLQSLNLSRNQLKEIPEWTRQLTQLQSLDISDNELTTLPDSLGQLTQLTELDLSDNQLTALPDSLGQLTQLESLNFL